MAGPTEIAGLSILGGYGSVRVGTGRNGTDSGRIDLRIRKTKTKFDVRADGEVCSADRRPKPHKIYEIPIF